MFAFYIAVWAALFYDNLPLQAIVFYSFAQMC